MNICDRFDVQDIYLEPNPDNIYYCSSNIASKKFTILMKWCLMTREHPELHEHIIDYLKNNPEEINKTNSCGWTPLMLSARNSNTVSTERTVEILLEHGASVNKIDVFQKKTALMYASSYSNSDSTERTVQLICNYSTDIDFRNINGETALMYASKDNDTVNAVKILLDNGADINLSDNLDYTPLMLSISNINIDIVKILLQNKANMEIYNKYGDSALDLAIYDDGDENLEDHEKAKKLEIIKLMFDHGANLSYSKYTREKLLDDHKFDIIDIVDSYELPVKYALD